MLWQRLIDRRVGRLGFKGLTLAVLGPAIIDRHEQRKIRNGGHTHFHLRLKSVFPDAAERSSRGDLWWVKEPHFDVLSRSGCPTFHEIVPGCGLYRYDIPMIMKGFAHLARWRQQETKTMRRGDSHITLEIVEAVAKPVEGWLCKVHLKNVDAWLKEDVE